MPGLVTTEIQHTLKQTVLEKVNVQSATQVHEFVQRRETVAAGSRIQSHFPSQRVQRKLRKHFAICIKLESEDDQFLRAKMCRKISLWFVQPISKSNSHR